ncbi:MAG: SpoIIE family protein phosphatase [Anaerolineales bacterium]|nr:SpoIIE family protein phosphatase [Anaerolineales bacterium]
MTAPDFELAKQAALERLERELSPRLTYHSLAHTRDEVLVAVERLARLEGIEDNETLLLLRTAALYHDIGFIESKIEHEAASARIAAETLPGFGYSSQQIEQICQIIMATRLPQSPTTHLQQIIADADLDGLGREDFMGRSRDLQRELTEFGELISWEDWYRRQLAFLQQHRYFTASAARLRQPGKERNIETLQEILAGFDSQGSSREAGFGEAAQFEAAISKAPLFQSLPAEEIQFLARMLRPLDYPDNTILFLEGDRGEYFFVVVAGAVEIIKALGTPDEHRIALRRSGEFIGEMSLLNRDGLRTASARTYGDTRLLELTRLDFDELLIRQPHLAYELMRVLSERLNASHNRALQDMQEKNRQLSEAYEALKAAQDQLVEQERVKRELEVAYEIQMSILPDSLPEVDGYDFGALIVPARMVGGDFFDLISFDGDQVGILVGDVTDKGVPAAIFMAQTLALFRAIVDPSMTPSQTLLEVNRRLLGMNRQRLFVTILYGILDRRSGKFSYARAGHEPPMLCMPDGEIVIPKIETGMPLGLFERPALDQQALALPAGSLMLLYTDGATDALVEPGSSFGERGLIEVLRHSALLPAQQVCDSIFKSLTSTGDPESRLDDITLVAVRSL